MNSRPFVCLGTVGVFVTLISNAHAVFEPAVAPEPSTIAMWSILGAAAIAVGWWRTRGKK